MLKTINIDGKQVVFCCNLLTLLIYKSQFNSDFFDDINTIQRWQSRILYGDEKKELEMLDLQYNAIWALAKTADEGIEPPDTWLDSFEEFDAPKIWLNLIDIITSSLKSDKKYSSAASNNERGQFHRNTEELTSVFLQHGLNIADFKYFTIGMALNLIYARTNDIKRSRGEEVSDASDQYRVLKANEADIERMYNNGEITEVKYKAFKDSLKEWEDG